MTGCACASSVPTHHPSSTSSCPVCRRPGGPGGYETCQRKLRGQFGAFSSTYTRALGALTVAHGTGAGCKKTWHAASDRLVAHGKGRNTGVDVKHGSYARYLGKRTGRLYATEKATAATNATAPREGGKVRSVGMASFGGCVR